MLLNDSISLSDDFFTRVGLLADPFGKDILAWLAICEKEGKDQVSFSRRPATAKAAAWFTPGWDRLPLLLRIQLEQELDARVWRYTDEEELHFPEIEPRPTFKPLELSQAFIDRYRSLPCPAGEDWLSLISLCSIEAARLFIKKKLFADGIEIVTRLVTEDLESWTGHKFHVFSREQNLRKAVWLASERWMECQLSPAWARYGRFEECSGV